MREINDYDEAKSRWQGQIPEPSVDIEHDLILDALFQAECERQDAANRALWAALQTGDPLAINQELDHQRRAK